MRRRRRLLIALALLTGGTAVALVSRRNTDESEPSISAYAPKSPKSLGPLPLDLAEEPVQPAHLSGRIEADMDESPAAPQEDATPSPEPPAAPVSDHWRPSMRTASYQAASAPATPSPPESPKPKADQKVSFVTHRIVDGDTLSDLAQRYLGSSKRFSVIFNANRDRLQSPDLLPIGAELRIPVAASGE
ncbi:MAG TPA: LysM peptidoglycan-binding domain-containing protein [Pirellulales bacterium]|nr:LysM peptidoglycan-binding domain-containing protein [Pirellulales bacterium]